MARTPSKIYLIQAYSKSLNSTKQEFDEDALVRKQHTVQEREARLKAESLANRLNRVAHKSATDWVARYPQMDYRPSGLVRSAQIISPTQRTR